MLDRAKILVVDDKPANLEVITETLSAHGHNTAAVTSGERALIWLESYQADLILLDVQMPGIDGFETCELIKKNAAIADTPIIFITALADSENIAKGFSFGAVDYISKPFQEVELLARVNTHLRLNQLNQSLEHQVRNRTSELEKTMAKLQGALSQLESSQVQLVRQEKMSTLGGLMAGVAHEINNPLGFVSGNIGELRRSLDDIVSCLNAYREAFPEPGETLEGLLEELDIDFVVDDIAAMLNSMELGCDRMRGISNSLRYFSRSDTDQKLSVDIHEGLNSTLLILKYRVKASDIRPKIEIIKDYGELPKLDCFPGQLNQVFMNILANAIDMFDEVSEASSDEAIMEGSQKITITTRLIKTQSIDENDVIEVSIADNGKGMQEEVVARVFDRQFTTKPVGKGTGLGLAIAQQIVTDTHGGTLDVQSEVGKGTEFRIRLPIGG